MISAGDTLLLPQFGYNCLGEGTWCGYGLVDYRSPGNLSTFIQGYFFGGQVSDLNAVVDPDYVASVSHAQPRRDPFWDSKTDADPVNMETAAFQVDHTDLSLGRGEPRGISFGRHYSSNGRLYSSGGMGPGWVNN